MTTICAVDLNGSYVKALPKSEWEKVIKKRNLPDFNNILNQLVGNLTLRHKRRICSKRNLKKFSRGTRRSRKRLIKLGQKEIIRDIEISRCGQVKKDFIKSIKKGNNDCIGRAIRRKI